MGRPRTSPGFLAVGYKARRRQWGASKPIVHRTGSYRGVRACVLARMRAQGPVRAHEWGRGNLLPVGMGRNVPSNGDHRDIGLTGD